MNITSLLITLAGIIIIIALYIISRISQSKLPKNQSSRLPNLEGENGDRFTSVLDDIPARDGSTPTVKKSSEEELTEDSKIGLDKNTDIENTQKEEAITPEKSEQQQHILFISGKDEAGLDGTLVQKALKKNGLVLADMDIYHYYPVIKNMLPDSGKYSLFRIANGVSPWTLKPDDLLGKKIAGLSIVMLTPTKIDDSEAISLFISLSEKICRQAGGVLKNQKQQLFTAKDKKNLLYSFKN